MGWVELDWVWLGSTWLSLFGFGWVGLGLVRFRLFDLYKNVKLLWIFASFVRKISMDKLK